MNISTVLSLAVSFAAVGVLIVMTVLSLFLFGYFVIYQKWMKGQKKLSGRRVAWWCVFSCYGFVVLSATLFMRYPSAMNDQVYPLFSSYYDSLILGDMGSWRNILYNYAMFMPLGFLLPLGWKKMQRSRRILLIGFLCSLLIECTQLLTHRGMFEADDLLGNTLGALIGFGLFLLLRKLVKSVQKKSSPVGKTSRSKTKIIAFP
ncbi:MAG: VanZ family protein [Acetatifactor sp.]|nr:VanZ family protein [Acetatifactor sp.]